MNHYDEFLLSKQKTHIASGFDVAEADLHHALFPFQKHCVRTALKAGRFALFEECGLGKTFQQLEWAKHVSMHTGRPVLILCPLAVAAQTILQGDQFGMVVDRFGKIHSERPYQIDIANYEQLQNIDTALYAGVVLDESSILKNFEGAYRNMIIDLFRDTPYKLACTATPSPNDPMELGNHAEFLNVMSRTEMLSMYFVHDGGNTSQWRLKSHAIKSFWRFVSSWAIMISRPSDIGFSDENYILPELEIVEHEVMAPADTKGALFTAGDVSATDYNSELRRTAPERLAYAAGVANASEEQFVIWIKHDSEGQMLRQLIPGAIEVSGKDRDEVKEQRLFDFAAGKFRVLITKGKIAMFGLNWQNCHNTIFASPDFSFELVYQCIRRFWRFGQARKVTAWFITTPSMANIGRIFNKKQKQFQEMQQQMQESLNRQCRPVYLGPEITNTPRFITTDKYQLMQGDCVREIKHVKSESIGFSVFSPPFAELYVYSGLLEDMGNSKDYRQFLRQFSFLIPELFRVMMPGRNVAVHCMPLPVQKGKEGYIGLRDLPGMIIKAFTKAGFIYHDEITIWKDPVVEMQRTKALGLLHKQVKKDSSMSRTGIQDKLVVFRKPGVNPEPIRNEGIPVDLWQKYASPVWYDINYSDTLNFRGAREEKDEKHICPLQLQTIERAIHLWSNPGDRVFTPFGGIMSEVYQAVVMGRFGIGIELKESYFRDGVKNCENAVKQTRQSTVLGLLGEAV